MESNHVTLNRQLGMREGITITTGTVIGVGLFTTGANCVGIMGSWHHPADLYRTVDLYFTSTDVCGNGRCSAVCRRYL